MEVLKVTLFALGAMSLVFIFGALPSIAMIKMRDAKLGVPGDVYRRARPHLFGVRPYHIYVLAGILCILDEAFNWLGWGHERNWMQYPGLALIALLAVWYFVWSIQTLRSGPDLDQRLRRFARFVLCGTSFGLIVMTLLLAEFGRIYFTGHS